MNWEKPLFELEEEKGPNLEANLKKANVLLKDALTRLESIKQVASPFERAAIATEGIKLIKRYFEESK